LVTGTVQGGVELTPTGVVKDVPLTFGIGQIIGFNWRDFEAVYLSSKVPGIILSN